MKKRKPSKEEITLNEIIEIAKERKMHHTTHIEVNGNTKTIILFGSFKLTFNKEDDTFNLQRLKQHSKTNSEWIPAEPDFKKTLYSSMRFYFLKSHSNSHKNPRSILSKSFNSAFEYLFADIHRKHNVVADIFLKEKNKSVYFVSGIGKTMPLKIINANGDTTMKIKINQYGRIVSSKNLKTCGYYGGIHAAIENKFIGGLYGRGWIIGDKLIGHFLREAINKEKMRDLRRVHPEKFFTEINLYDYITFNHRLTGECGSLAPLIPYLPDNAVCDGSNEWFISRVAEKLSRGEIKTIRKAPVSIMRLIGLSHNGNLYPSSLLLLVKFLRLPYANNFPKVVLCDIWEAINHYDESTFKILAKWMMHHRLIWKEHGYKQHNEYWRLYIDQLRHSIDWILDTQQQIQKTQYWPSIWRKASQWKPSHRREFLNVTWKPVIHEPVCINGVSFSELASSEALFVEGEEMHHCIYSYTPHCEKSNYHVFKVESKTERATLGVRVDKSQCKLDQIYTYCNEHVSAQLKKTANQFLKKQLILG